MQLWSTQSCFWMVLPHNKCRNNTITTIGVMYSSYCQSWSTSCLQIFVKGRLLWQLRLLSKSSGMEHLHPLCDLGLYGGLFQTERCSVFENNNNNNTIKSSFPHFFLGPKSKKKKNQKTNLVSAPEMQKNQPSFPIISRCSGILVLNRLNESSAATTAKGRFWPQHLGGSGLHS